MKTFSRKYFHKMICYHRFRTYHSFVVPCGLCQPCLNARRGNYPATFFCLHPRIAHVRYVVKL